MQGTLCSSSESFVCSLCVFVPCPHPFFSKRHSEVGCIENKAGLSSNKLCLRVSVGKELGSFLAHFTFGAAGWQLLGVFVFLVVPVLCVIKTTLSGTASSPVENNCALLRLSVQCPQPWNEELQPFLWGFYSQKIKHHTDAYLFMYMVYRSQEGLLLSLVLGALCASDILLAN